MMNKNNLMRHLGSDHHTRPCLGQTRHYFDHSLVIDPSLL